MTVNASFPYIDDSVRPQDDLNKHVNGKWLATAEIPDDLDGYGSFLELRDKAEADVRAILEQAAAGGAGEGEQAAITERIGTFYAAFMDAEQAEKLQLTPAQPYLEKLQAVSTVAELVELSATWQREGIDGLFGAGAMRDAGDPTRMLWHIFQGGLGLPDEAYYREDTYAETRQKYQHYLTRVLTMAGFANAAEAAEEVLGLETRLAKAHWDRVTTRDAQKRYNLTPLAEAQELFPLLDEALTGWGISEKHSAELVIGMPDVLPAFHQALTEETLAVWKNWLATKVLSSMAPLLHEEIVQEHFEFFTKTLGGATQLKERWKRGVALTNASLGEDVGQIYVDKHYPADAQAAMDELIAALVEAYRRSISQLPWMGEETREKALEKLHALRPMIGCPVKWIDYSDVQVAADDVVGNAARAATSQWKRDLQKLEDGPDPDEWHMTPQTVNAYYSPLESVICFPAAILQPPFFSAEQDMAQNLGGIGAVIGHEIGHGFDDQGSRYGADGSLTNWWTDQDRSAFEERTASLVQQYNLLSPSVLDDEHTVNGELTLGENIGDLGGVGIAHKAYKLWLASKNQSVDITEVDGPDEDDDDVADGLTGDQRLFYSWAQVWRNKTRVERAMTLLSIDPHAPAEFRAVQPLKNVDAFHEAFGTVEGDEMYLPPEQRVTIW